MKYIKLWENFISESTNLDSLFLGQTVLDIRDFCSELRHNSISGIHNKVITALDKFNTQEEAIDFLKKHGYSIGKYQSGAPIGIKEGSFDIQKWRNLEGDLDILDGFIVEIEGDYYIFYIVFPSH